MVYVYMMNVGWFRWLSVSLSACKYFIRFHVFENTLKVLCSYTFYYSDVMVIYGAFVLRFTDLYRVVRHIGILHRKQYQYKQKL